ncbi:hypothetical protein PRIPAC_78007 [Pristionchus pacificus]|nr:hypothetical protein PRIPAC_78007 [Pristionchus pacificus]
MTFWPELIRAVNQAEGSIGIAFNVYTIILLWKKKFALNARAYRISITISSIHAILMSLIVPIFASASHVFHYDKFIIVMYGAVASSPWFFQQLAVFYSFFCAYTIWEMQHCFFFYQSSDFDQIVIKVHNLSTSEYFIAFGGTFHSTQEHPNSVLRLALEGIMPSYLVSYLVFGTCIVKIHKALNFGVRLSQKTLRMQRKFFLMMMLQTLLPLLIFAFPLSLFIYSLVVGSALDLYTIAISISVWSIPSVQAIVHLSFVVNDNAATRRAIRARCLRLGSRLR